MERTSVLKVVFAALVFCGIFVGLTALGLYFLDTALTGEEEDVAPTDYPERRGSSPPATGKAPIEKAPVPAPSRVASDVAAEIELLASPSFRVRVDAETRLVGMGEGAVPLLEQALRHPDPEVRWRAKEAIRRIREGR